ncbi:MAG: catalase [Panacagrimonas sp.]
MSPKSTLAAPKRARRRLGDQNPEVGHGGEVHQTAGGDVPTLTTQQGVPVSDDQNSLRIGARGPTLIEDFHFREKIFHFDHERIPERVVHARGFGAHGYFENNECLADVTRADLFQRPGEKTPVFVRFSTVAGSKGSADLARDVRGFAVKLYTKEGNWDLVGNNVPVFFIQDAIKFPDLIHAVKPEPDTGIPQAASAHDTFWDFVSLTPETTHMLMWVMSDRALPRSLSTMEGFGVHTFRLVNAAGEAQLVKFHWKPKAGTHSLLWEEAVQMSGADSDFHRRDLWTLIENGHFPEWELGLQVFSEKDAQQWPFDVLDATKLVPEEWVPVQIVGRMVLDRNPDNFFAETEQVAFSPGHLVPGIDVSEDPLLQGRIFSYQDTQLSRLGSPNFHELPINRAQCPVNSNQRDGHMRVTIDRGQTAYQPNRVGGGCPFPSKSGFVTFPAPVSGTKLRKRAESFADHFSQARLFYSSQSPVEQRHIIAAFQFELAKCRLPEVRERVVGNLAQVDASLAQAVSAALNIAPPEAPATQPDADAGTSPLLSLFARPGATGIQGMNIAVLVGESVDDGQVKAAKKMLEAEGATVKTLAATLAPVQGQGGSVAVDHTYATMPSVVFDAVFVPGRKTWAVGSAGYRREVEFVRGTFEFLKTIIFCKDAKALIDAAQVDAKAQGVLHVPQDAQQWASAVRTLARRKHYEREANAAD